MKFLDVKTDLAFKKVFASDGSKAILISFLNEILYAGRAQQVADLTIVDPYTIPLIKGMKDTYVDVKAVLNDGTQVIIEMQVLNHQGFEKRILYNAAKNYSVQLQKGEDYTLLNPVIALTLVDFTMFEQHPEVTSRFKLLEKDSLIEYSDDIELVFVELPKFTVAFEELSTDSVTEQWLYFVKHAGEMEFIPDSFADPVKAAFSLIDESAMSVKELEAQHKRKEFIFIQKASLALAEERGKEEGRKEGKEEGRKEGKEEGREEVAKNMLAAGMPVEQVAQLTGLSETHIRSLT